MFARAPALVASEVSLERREVLVTNATRDFHNLQTGGFEDGLRVLDSDAGIPLAKGIARSAEKAFREVGWIEVRCAGDIRT